MEIIKKAKKMGKQSNGEQLCIYHHPPKILDYEIQES